VKQAISPTYTWKISWTIVVDLQNRGSLLHVYESTDLQQHDYQVSTLIATLALCLAELPRSATAADRLPDPGMAWLSDLTIDNTTDGRRRLRFTTTIVNIGAGAFELHGKRASTPQPDMDVTQRIFQRHKI
jgi:hypothetical protein